MVKDVSYSGIPRNFFQEGGSANSVEDRGVGRENGDMGVVAP
jgi:hypothetical protein